MRKSYIISSVLILALLVGVLADLLFYWAMPVNQLAFFPLEPGSTWTYLVKSQSQQQNYLITDRALGERFIDKLNRNCQVVDENYEIERGGVRPVLYYSNQGYLNRLSGLEYVGEQIEFPPFTLSIEHQFLPINMRPSESWNGPIEPYGGMPKAPTISQSHRSFAESQEVVTQAGHFKDCLRIETEARFSGGAYEQPMLLNYREWYARGVGLVKSLATKDGFQGDPIESVELLKFQTPELSGPVPDTTDN
ncbi:MAG: hypothetical protein WBY93_04085 [Candidatus Binatus sp.]